MPKPIRNLCVFLAVIVPIVAQPQPRAATPVLSPPAPNHQLRPRIDPRNMYERVIAIVPVSSVIGKGTMADPKRPMYAPVPAAVDLKGRTGILAFSQVISDDGEFAIVEYVAANKSAFKNILADNTIQKFVKGKDNPTTIQNTLKQYKKDFDFNHFGVRMP